jgi:hypothetical protein
MILIAPPHIGTIRNTVTSIQVWEGTEGEWIWAHHPFGSYVCGFKIFDQETTTLRPGIQSKTRTRTGRKQ